MSHWWRIAVIVIGFSCAAFGQACTTQALRTVSQAEDAAAAGDDAGAKRLLQRAFEECQLSPVALRKIAALYAMLGDNTQAQLFRQQADRLEGKPVITFKQKPTEDARAAENENDSFVREKWA